MSLRSMAALFVVAGLLGPAPAAAQESGEPLTSGLPAPDFESVASTRYGVLSDSIRLSDFRGKTVVLAFFFKARTPG